MSGARVSSGPGSKQDYRTPADLMVAVGKRFGPVVFDLAATAENAQHERYFAPKEFVDEGTLEDLALDSVWERDFSDGPLGRVVSKGDISVELIRRSKKGRVFRRKIKNHDSKAYALDAFAQPWAPLSEEWAVNGEPGLLWLNCEFGDIPRWVDKCISSPGANILLLTPASVGANWFRDRVAGFADVYILNGRPAFIDGEVYNKDCMVSHFAPWSSGRLTLWDWRRDQISRLWVRLQGVWEEVYKHYHDNREVLP